MVPAGLVGSLPFIGMGGMRGPRLRAGGLCCCRVAVALVGRAGDVAPAVGERVGLLDDGDKPVGDVTVGGPDGCLEQLVLVLQGEVHQSPSWSSFASRTRSSGMYLRRVRAADSGSSIRIVVVRFPKPASIAAAWAESSPCATRSARSGWSRRRRRMV